MDINKSLRDIEYNQKYFRIQSFEPYEYQRKYYSLKGENGKLAKARCLMAANQIGKTLGEGAEVAYHATGLYPDWWEGHRIRSPKRNEVIVCAGKNSYTTRDVIQSELLGTADKDDNDHIGTGWIPKHLIHKLDRKPGIPGAVEKIYVKSKDGMSLHCIILLSYEDGAGKFMGKRVLYGWNDEEPPMDIWEQMVRGTIATQGPLALTYTPEDGMTQLAYRFSNDCPENYAMLNATWDDAPHITPERREELLAEMMPYEREMRSRGQPLVGDSMVFPLPDEDISCDPFPIPDSYHQINGIDFGGDHPFAAVNIAYDPSTGIGYLNKAFKQRRLLISEESSVLKKQFDAKTIPTAWPHDGNKQDKASGKVIADLYREEDVNMLDLCFSNPPDLGKQEGTGGQGVEAGLKKLYWDLSEGRLKVFSNLEEWFKEKGAYHRKDGNVVRLQDDLMSATRYAHLSAVNNDGTFRFAESVKKSSDFMRPLDINLNFVR